MNFDNLKEAWNLFKFLNNFDAISEQEVWSLIEKEATPPINLKRRIIQNSVICLILTLVCQAG